MIDSPHLIPSIYIAFNYNRVTQFNAHAQIAIKINFIQAYTCMSWDEIKLLYSCTKELLQRMSDAAEAIAKGDLVSKIIRAESQWGLLPIQVYHMTVT